QLALVPVTFWDRLEVYAMALSHAVHADASTHHENSNGHSTNGTGVNGSSNGHHPPDDAPSAVDPALYLARAALSIFRTGAPGAKLPRQTQKDLGRYAEWVESVRSELHRMQKDGASIQERRQAFEVLWTAARLNPDLSDLVAAVDELDLTMGGETDESEG